jgi:alcohol dehydrogenase class IV
MLVAGGRSTRLGERLTRGLPVVLVWAEVAQHVPAETAARAIDAAAAESDDLIVCVGGGSTVGMAKAVALTRRIPIVAVPTTYAGSEATDVWGVTREGRKVTGTDPAVLPVAVVCDADLTAALETGATVSSIVNGVPHCVDSLWAPRANPLNAALAQEGLRALASGVREIVDTPDAVSAREVSQYGAYVAAVAFAAAGAGVHHKICHALGGTFGLPHAETHAVVLPRVGAFNLPAAPEAGARVVAAREGADSSPHAATTLIDQLYRDAGAPRSLRELGMREQDLDTAVDVILPTIPLSNPRAMGAGELSALLRDAWAGAPSN